MNVLIFIQCVFFFVSSIICHVLVLCSSTFPSRSASGDKWLARFFIHKRNIIICMPCAMILFHFFVGPLVAVIFVIIFVLAYISAPQALRQFFAYRYVPLLNGKETTIMWSHPFRLSFGSRHFMHPLFIQRLILLIALHFLIKIFKNKRPVVHIGFHFDFFTICEIVHQLTIDHDFSVLFFSFFPRSLNY